MEKPEIISVLQNAKMAHDAGDFTNALSFYETFFDQSLEQDPYAYYGIRLTHCLEGWAELAMVFPGAKKRLESKRREVLEDYQQNKVPERFHDFLAISQQLGLEEKALEEFLRLHTQEPKSAAKLVKYIWHTLINYELWQVCSELLEQPNQKLDELISVFEEAQKLKELDSSFDSHAFDQHTVEQLFEGVSQLVLILRHSNRAAEIGDLERQFYQAVQSNSNALLSKEVQAKGSYLFAGH